MDRADDETAMTALEQLVEAWARWHQLLSRKRARQYVREATLRDAREAVEDISERVLAERTHGCTR